MAVSFNDLIVGPLVPAAGIRVISLDFYFERAEWLKVYRSGSDEPLALGGAYTVQGEGTGSGSITLNTAANGEDAYTIFLVVPLERSSDMQLRGEFRSGPFNLEMDRLWQRLQLHATELGRSFQLSKTATGSTSITPVPNKVLGFDDGGDVTTYSLNPIITGPGLPVYDTVQSFMASSEGPRGIGAAWLVGPFQYIEASPAADSNTYAVRNQANVKLEAVPIMGMWSPDQWGVLPNDADQHSKIERCIYYVWTRGGGTINFSAGTYLVSKPVRVKSGIVIDGGPPTQFTGDSSVTIQAAANFVGAAVLDVDNRTAEQGADQSPPALIPEVTVPDAPTSLTATPSNGQAVLSWQAPADNGGAAITGYQIERNAGGGWAVLGTVGDVLTYADTGLTNGVSYAYRVSAINTEGTGPASAEASAIPFTVPTAPQNLVAVGGDETATLTWEAPASDGFSPITGYFIERNAGGAGWVTEATVGNVLTYTDMGAAPGVVIEYRVSAINAAGTGPASSAATASAGTVPAAPQNLTATPGDENVTLNWQAPTDDGGLAITGYRVERNAAGAGWVTYATLGNVLTYVDTATLNGTTYEYRVSAVNAQGNGPASNVASAVPVTIPSAPQNLTATPGDAEATLAWQAPSFTGGSAITGYQIERNAAGAGWSVLGTVGAVLTFADTGLTNGVTYEYRVSAINAQGTGPASNVASAIPVASPLPLPIDFGTNLYRDGTRYYTDDTAAARLAAFTGGTVYVATTGDDVTGDGSVGAPYATLDTAIAAATALDTISIAAGAYAFPSAPVSKSLAFIPTGGFVMLGEMTNLSGVTLTRDIDNSFVTATPYGGFVRTDAVTNAFDVRGAASMAPNYGDAVVIARNQGFPMFDVDNAPEYRFILDDAATQAEFDALKAQGNLYAWADGSTQQMTVSAGATVFLGAGMMLCSAATVLTIDAGAEVIADRAHFYSSADSIVIAGGVFRQFGARLAGSLNNGIDYAGSGLGVEVDCQYWNCIGNCSTAHATSNVLRIGGRYGNSNRQIRDVQDGLTFVFSATFSQERITTTQFLGYGRTGEDLTQGAYGDLTFIGTSSDTPVGTFDSTDVRNIELTDPWTYTA